MTAVDQPAGKATRPLRVTMLGIRGFPNVQGGAENHAEHLATELVELGCDIEVIVRTPYVPKGTTYPLPGVKLSRVWSPRRTGVEAFAPPSLSLWLLLPALGRISVRGGGIGRRLRG